jgi:hypothetical protein
VGSFLTAEMQNARVTLFDYHLSGVVTRSVP